MQRAHRPHTHQTCNFHMFQDKISAIKTPSKNKKRSREGKLRQEITGVGDAGLFLTDTWKQDVSRIEPLTNEVVR